MDSVTICVYHLAEASGDSDPKVRYTFGEPQPRQSTGDVAHSLLTIHRRAVVRIPDGAGLLSNDDGRSFILRWSHRGMEQREEAAAVLAHAEEREYGFEVDEPPGEHWGP